MHRGRGTCFSCKRLGPQAKTRRSDRYVQNTPAFTFAIFRLDFDAGLFANGHGNRPKLRGSSSRHTPQLAGFLFAMKLIALVIFLGAVMIAAAIVLANRHTLELAREGASAWQLDQLTGELRYCGINSQSRERGCFVVPTEKIEKF